MKQTMDDYLNTAIDAARLAGGILKRYYGRVKPEEVRKKAQNDFISFVDETSEKAILELIRGRYPRHTFLAEESGGTEIARGYRWIIDPLDGTKNYLSNVPVFAVSIALEHEGSLIAGVIYDPLNDQMYSAAKGQGAFLNGTPIHVSKNQKLAESLMATGFPFKTKHLLHPYMHVFEEIFSASLGVRRLGSAAMDLAYVACGTFDGFWEIGLKPWDVAAGALLVREAGGMVTDFWDGDAFLSCSYILASNGAIHQQTGDIIRETFPFYKPVEEGAAQ